VLGLGQQVERHELRVGAARGEHRELAGPGDAVDAHLAHHLALGLLHEDVARAGDHVHGPHRLGPVRERGDRLRPAHPVDLVHLAEHAGGQHDRLGAAPRARRRTDGDLVDAGGTRRNGEHH
jgi:hypothetical protein